MKKIEYTHMIDSCLAEFSEKKEKYGSSWLILRIYSLAEQVYIKIRRVREIQERGVQKVEDPIEKEFTGIFNYCIFAKIKIRFTKEKLDLSSSYERDGFNLYNTEVAEIQDLYSRKNHDYGEVWRELHISTMVDLMLTKFFRLMNIYHDEKLKDEEKLDDYNEIFNDIANYSIFCKVLIAQGTVSVMK